MADTAELINELASLTDRLKNGEVKTAFLITIIKEKTISVVGQPDLYLEESVGKALQTLIEAASQRYMDEGCPVDSGTFIHTMFLIGYNIHMENFDAAFFRSIYMN